MNVPSLSLSPAPWRLRASDTPAYRRLTWYAPGPSGWDSEPGSVERRGPAVLRAGPVGAVLADGDGGGPEDDVLEVGELRQPVQPVAGAARRPPAGRALHVSV